MKLFLIRAIRVIRGQNPPMKHEEITQDIIGAAMAVLNDGANRKEPLLLS